MEPHDEIETLSFVVKIESLLSVINNEESSSEYESLRIAPASVNPKN